MVVLAFYALSRISVGNTFIACMLTIVGYSINATIVIFDRIRENLKTAGKKADLKELVNMSITQTLTRSIYTSFTTFITIFVVFVMGVSSIREFALPIMVGIVCHENEIRKKYKVEEIGNQKAVAAMQQLFSITAKMRSRQHGKMDGSS